MKKQILLSAQSSFYSLADRETEAEISFFSLHTAATDQ